MNNHSIDESNISVDGIQSTKEDFTVNTKEEQNLSTGNSFFLCYNGRSDSIIKFFPGFLLCCSYSASIGGLGSLGLLELKIY
jgi:hypothetical protein